MTEQERTEPPARRLKMPKGYQAASPDARLLSWSHVVEQLEQALNYWIATTRPDGRPHVTPVWGAWMDDAFYFDGIYTARWARNLAANPAISVHLESGADVVIVEGMGEDVVTDADVGARIVEAWAAKYGRLLPDPVGGGMYRVRPRAVRAWSQFPDDATCWRFGDA
jgi:hypothetical protein